MSEPFQHDMFRRPKPTLHKVPPEASPEAYALGALLIASHVGLGKAAVESTLSRALGEQGVLLHGPGLRQAVNELRTKGMLVGSHPSVGYWLIEEEGERQLTLRHLLSRVREQAKVIRSLDRAWGDRLQAALDFNGNPSGKDP